jgi:regulation of enolase protein 1 (concanavalin A-like superfamily)
MKPDPLPPFFIEDFDTERISPDLSWFNPPESWGIEDGRLWIQPEVTDFWSRTHYGFSFDNGHFLYYQTTRDFILRTKINFTPRNQYDQAGLMVRISPECWLKTSVEYEDETLSRLGVVVTNFGYSDWSTQDFDPTIHEIELQVGKTGMDYQVDYRVASSDWSQIRIAHLHQETKGVQCGLYACCPKAVGFRAAFDTLTLFPVKGD